MAVVPMTAAMMGKESISNWQASQLNLQTYEMWRRRLTAEVINSIRWRGLESFDIPPEYVEKQLISGPLSGFFCRVDGIPESFAFASAVIQGKYDIYMMPRKVRFKSPISSQSWMRYNCDMFEVVDKKRKYHDRNAVIIYDNSQHVESLSIIDNFARQLANMDRVMEINMNVQKTPLIFYGPEEQRSTLSNVGMSITGGDSTLFLNNNFDDFNKIDILNLEAPYISDKVNVDQMKLWQKALSYFGIDNANTDKKERLITDEVESNQEELFIIRNNRLQQRRLAAEKVYEIFGIEINPYWNGKNDQ